jgi:thiopurine S-methyltransferase
MGPDFWRDRWREGRIGFHLPRVNPRLERHAARLPEPPSRILVPLAGKSLDVAFLLARGHEVVAVELVGAAIEAFFEERGLQPTVEVVRGHRVHRTGSLSFVEADIFALSPADVGAVDGIWDRAALIALPPGDRQRYLPHLLGLLRPGGRELLVTLEYDQARGEGPPFAVLEDELRALAGGASLELLERVDVLPESARFAAEGHRWLNEAVWSLVKPGA